MWTSYRSGLLVLVLLASGCFSHTAAKDKYAAYYGCPASQVTTEELESDGHSKVLVRGCGPEETFYCLGIKCRSPRLTSIRLFSDAERCPEKDVKAESAGGDAWAVSGCGKSAKFDCSEASTDVIRCAKAP